MQELGAFASEAGAFENLLGDCTAYIEQNQKIFAKRSVRRVFVTSCESVDYGVKKFLEENDMEYKIIPYFA